MKRSLPFLIVFVAAALCLGGGTVLYRAKKRTPAPAAAPEPTTAATAASDDMKPTHVRGEANAPVTLEEFGDLQCPSCATTAGVLHDLQTAYGPKLRLVFFHFPLEMMHRHAREAARAAEAASLQGHFWEMHDMLYKNQTAWSNAPDVAPLFADYANNAGLDVAQFRHDFAGRAVNAAVDQQHEYGVKRGVKSTPTLFLNGQEFPPPFTPEALRKAVDTILAEKKVP